MQNSKNKKAKTRGAILDDACNLPSHATRMIMLEMRSPDTLAASFLLRSRLLPRFRRRVPMALSTSMAMCSTLLLLAGTSTTKSSSGQRASACASCAAGETLSQDFRVSPGSQDPKVLRLSSDCLRTFDSLRTFRKVLSLGRLCRHASALPSKSCQTHT